MEEKAILGVPWTVGSYAANKILTTVTTLMLAHLLSPSDFGVIAIVLGVVGAGVWSLVFGQIGSYALYAGALIWLSPHRRWPGFDGTQVRSIATTGRGFAAQGSPCSSARTLTA